MTYVVSVTTAAIIATTGASAVLAEGPACVVEGVPVTQEQAAADPTLCPADPAPAPDPAPTPDPAPPADPAPTPDPAPPVDPAPAPNPAAPIEPAPADPSPQTQDPTATGPTSTPPVADPTSPEPVTPDPTIQQPTPARPPRATEPRPEGPQPKVETTTPRAAAPTQAKEYQTAPFRDARLFREQFTPKGRIPAQPKMPEAQAQLLADAARGTGTSWATLTAVAWLESRWSDPVAGGILGRRLSPDAWRAYGTDGDGDGRVTRSSDADQARTVAVFIATSRGNETESLRAYFSGARRNVMAARAMFLADYYDALGRRALVDGLDDPDVRAAIESRLLANVDIEIYDGGRSDIAAGLVDPRTLVTIEFLANRFNTVTISSLISGHGVFTSSGNISLHSYGQAMDVAALDGESILGNQQKGGRTYRAVRELLLLPEAMQPAELISLWDMGMPSFAAADHHDHIHVGWKTEPIPAL